MPSIDKIYLYENFSQIKNMELHKEIKKSNKKLLKKKKLQVLPKKYRKLQDHKIKYFEQKFIKRWFISFVSVTSKKGSIIKYNNFILLVFKKLKVTYDLFNFFYILEQNLIMTFESFKKKIAGRNFLIPLGLDPYKRINAITKLIISSLKLRKEKGFVNKLYNELIDIFNNRGFSINKRINYTKQLKEQLTNIRFLNEKYV